MNDKLKNYITAPDPEVWEGIEKTMRRRAIRRQVRAASAGAALVALAVVGVVFWPTSKDGVSAPSAPAEVAQAPVPEIVNNVPTMQQLAAPQVVESRPAAATPAPIKLEQVVANEPAQTLQVRQEVVETVLEQVVDKVQPAEPQEVDRQSTTVAEVTVSPVEEIRPAVEPAMVESQPSTPKVGISTTGVMEDTILWMPNIFVPGSDDEGINTFRARLNHPGEVLNHFRIAVYNRMGNQVFMSNDINRGWDGTFRGRQLPQATYVYVIEYADKDGLRHQRRGTVTLVR